MTMARLIDADRALEIVRDQGIAHPNAYHLTNYATFILLEAPTVDAVEVVRCKDCQKCLIDNSKMELNLCMKSPSFPVRVKLDGFCSDGERKGDGGNG